MQVWIPKGATREEIDAILERTRKDYNEWLGIPEPTPEELEKQREEDIKMLAGSLFRLRHMIDQCKASIKRNFPEDYDRVVEEYEKLLKEYKEGL